MAASEKLTGKIGTERVLKSKTLACIKVALLSENKSRHLQFVLLNRNLKYSEYYEQAKKDLFADAMSLSVVSCIFHQGIAVLHSKGTWTSIMSDNINNCHLHLVYVSDGPITCGTFFPITRIPLDDPLHPEHADNVQQRNTKAGGSASKRCQVKSSSKSDKKTAAQEPTTNTRVSSCPINPIKSYIFGIVL